MKKQILMLAALATTACVRDNGNYDYTPLPDVEVTGIAPNYQKVLPADDMLTIDPTLAQGDYDYAWVMLVKTGETGLQLREDTVSTARKLELPVAAYSPGDHPMFFYARNRTTGVLTHVRTNIEVQTEYSRGTYILKETAAGDTELDILLDDQRLAQDLIEGKSGAALEGAPRDLAMLYDYPTIDPSTMTRVNAYALGITTMAGKAQLMSTNDMHVMMNQDDMFYEAPAGETPFKFTYNQGSNSYLSNAGVRSVGIAATPSSSGKLGVAADYPASDHTAYLTLGMGQLVWDAAADRMFVLNSQGKASLMSHDTFGDFSGLNSTCVYMEEMNWGAVAVLRDKTTGALTVYYIEGPDMMATSYNITATPVPGTSKLNTATLMAANQVPMNHRSSVRKLFFVEGNKLHQFDLNTAAEVEITPTGMPSGTITFVGNLHTNMQTPAVNSLAAAVDNGGNYSLAAWPITATGELAAGAPTTTAMGTGKVKDVTYANSAMAHTAISGGSFFGAHQTYFMPFDPYPQFYGYSR